MNLVRLGKIRSNACMPSFGWAIIDSWMQNGVYILYTRQSVNFDGKPYSNRPSWVAKHFRTKMENFQGIFKMAFPNKH